jgi:uncharacterized DUF497 family protein
VSPRIARFQWDEANLAHIARHGITRAEVEQAFLDPSARVEGNAIREGEVRFQMLGETHAGRVLTVIFIIRGGEIRTVTAYPANGGLLARYNAGRLR